MLQVCSSVLLLTRAKSFEEQFQRICSECDVSLRIEPEWNENFRIKEDIVICGSKYIDKINKAYYPSVVLILKEDESFLSYINTGITRFIFDYTDERELMYALMQMKKVYVQSKDTDLKSVLEDSNSLDFVHGDYEFYFTKDKFLYKGKELYFTKACKLYLAEWLLRGHKDNKKRMFLFNLRKNIDENFLRDVGRHGQFMKEEKNEQYS